MRLVYSYYDRTAHHWKQGTWSKTGAAESLMRDRLQRGADKWRAELFNLTKPMREQPHTTPGTTTWTADFLTREGEGQKAMGDWLHDKLIKWKARRRLLQANSGTFPCESRLQKWGKHSDGICGLCKRCREMGLGLLVWKTRSRHHRSPTKQRV
jgi:hypothetical protein